MRLRPALVFASAVTACATALGACSTSGPDSTWTFDGRRVTGIEDSLSRMESAWRASVANAGTRANVPLDAQCYFQVNAAAEIGDRVLCGPLRLLGDADTTFQTHPLTMTEDFDHTDAGDGIPTDDPGSVRLVLSPDQGSTTTTFTPHAQPDPGTVAQRRPDGATAPLEAALDEPTVVTASTPSLTLPELLKGRRITAQTPAGAVSFVVARTQNTVDTAPGFATGVKQVPPDGGSLLVVSAVGLGLGPGSGPSAGVVATVDDRTLVLSPDQLPTGAVVPVKAGATSVTVGVTYAGKTQRFDASTGRRLTTSAASFYDGLALTSKTRCAGVETGRAASAAGWRQSFSCDLSLTRTPFLPPAPPTSARQVSGWAADGKTFVVLVVTPSERTTYVTPGVGGATYDPSYFSFGTRLVVGGTSYNPRQISVEQAEGARPATITAVFEVPAGRPRIDVRGFVSTRLEPPAGADQKNRAGAPDEGNFTYPIDSGATFAPAKR